jgi:hypothetical protein
MTNIDEQMREEFHRLATRYQGDVEPPDSVLLGVRRLRRGSGIGLAAVTGAAVAAIVLAATSLTNLDSPRPQPTQPAGAGLPAGHFVGLRPSHSDEYAWTFSATTGRPVQRLAEATAVVGITADRRRVLITHYSYSPPGPVCTNGFPYALVSVTTGETTPPFPAAYQVTSAAIGGQTAVGVATPLTGSDGCGYGSPPRLVPQTLLVRDLSTGQLRSYPIPSVFGDVLRTGGVAAVSPDGRWVVLVNRTSNPDHQTAYLVSIDPGVTSLQGTEIRAAPLWCLPPVTHRSPYHVFAFRPDNQLTVNRFCGPTMTIIDYDPVTLRQTAAVAIPEPPGPPVTSFTTSWDRTGTDALVETGARKIYILRDGRLHPINTEANEVTW